MPQNGHSTPEQAARLLGRHPLRFICAWSQELTLRPCPRHDHPVMELVYHPAGSGVTGLDDGSSLAFADGSVVLYSANVAHDQLASRPGTEVCLHVQATRETEALFPQAASFAPVADPYIGEEFWSLSRTPARPDAALAAVLDLRVTALVLRLLIAARHNDEAPDAQTLYLQRARQYLQDRFASVASAAEVAEHVGVSEDYLRHLFQQREQTSLNQVLTTMRLERAKELLRHSRLPLKDIAAQCGFQTERYFCTRFSARVGITPGAYRNQPRGPRPPPLPGERRNG